MSRPSDRGRPRRRVEVAEQQPDRRRLARAVRPEEAEDLALADRDREVLERPDLAGRLVAGPVDRRLAMAVPLRQPGGREGVHPCRRLQDRRAAMTPRLGAPPGGEVRCRSPFRSCRGSRPSSLPFSKVVEANGFVFLAGQIGDAPGSNGPVPGGIEAETRAALDNVGAAAPRGRARLRRRREVHALPHRLRRLRGDERGLPRVLPGRPADAGDGRGHRAGPRVRSSRSR